MKRRGIFFIIFISIMKMIFSQKLDVGVILPASSGNELKQIISEELEKNFQDQDFKVRIKNISYVDSNNFKAVLNKMEKDSNLGGIFIMTYEIPQELKVSAKNKFISYGMGMLPLTNENYRDLNYIYSDIDIGADIKYLKELNNIENIAVIIPRSSSKASGKYLVAEAEKNGVKARLLYPDEEAAKTLQGFDAVYIIGANPRMRNVLEQATAKKIPSYLVDLSNMYKNKTLMGYNFSKELRKRARALSLNYRNYILKKPESIVQNTGRLERNIYYNMDIAKKINIYPDYSLSNSLTLINESKILKKKLTLLDAIHITIADNPEVRSSFQDIDSQKYQVKVTNSQRLPQLQGNMNYETVDKNIAGGLGGKPQNEILGNISLSQIIFSDQANADVEIQKLTLDSVKSQYRQQVLQYIYNVCATYLDILRLNAQLQVEKNNYILVEETLNIAKINYEAGAVGIQDVYRLQSSLANARSSIAVNTAKLKDQQVALNTYLRMPVNTEYEYQTFEELKDLFLLNPDILKKYTYKGSGDIDSLVNFLVQGSLKNSPQLYQLGKNIEIKEREYKTYKRQRYLPVVQATGQYYKDNIVRRPWGKGSKESGPNDYWEASVEFTLPLIKGGEIIYSMDQTTSQIKSLEYQKTGLEDNITQSVNQQVTQILSDYILTDTTKISAEAAKGNLKIVKNLYDQGSSTIVDFLDAQNNALSAELQSVIADYNLLTDNAALENTYGDYIMLKSDSERKAIFNRVKSLLY